MKRAMHASALTTQVDGYTTLPPASPKQERQQQVI
jgi:hypothetical protein